MRRTILAAAAAGAAAAIVTVGAATASADAKIEHISFVSTEATGTYSVVGTGVFTDGGVAELLNGHGTLWLRSGTIKVTIKAGTPSQRVDPRTCLGVVTQSGTYRLVGGTGAYKGISGSGRYADHSTEIGKMVRGKCSKTANPVAVQSIIGGSGPVSLR